MSRCNAAAHGFLNIFQSSQTVVKVPHSFIEKPYSEIQIRSKSNPEEIRNLQPCRKLVDLAERQNHQQDQDPQNYQPDQCKAKCLKIEENDAPEKVKQQLKEE